MRTGLLTDFYELTMLDAVLKSGRGNRKVHFELFTRRLPAGMDYGIVGGTYRAIEAVRNFSFSEDELQYLQETLRLSAEAVEFLRAYKFTGDIHGYHEGERYFAYSPVFQVEGTLAECLVLETVLLSIFNWDSAVMTRASHCVRAANGRATLLEMGSRRTHEDAAVAAARAAYIAGFVGTSNVQAGFTYKVPVIGTVAHAFILAHDSEEEAFRTQVERFGPDTTFLVDTYDIPTGIRAAVKAAGADAKAAVRIDSGDLREEAKAARILLDSLGATQWRIVLSGDMDENSIANVMKPELQEIDIATMTAQDASTTSGRHFVDSIGVGTSLVTAPSPGFVYKLVAIDDGHGSMRPVEKKSSNKRSLGGAKYAWRLLRSDGTDSTDVVTNNPHWVPAEDFRDVRHLLVKNGETTYPTLSAYDLVERAKQTHSVGLRMMPSILDRDARPMHAEVIFVRKEES